MRILQLCHKPPHPLRDGGSIAMHQLSRFMLDQGFQLKILAYEPLTSKLQKAGDSTAFARQTAYEGIRIDNRIHPLQALVNMLGTDPIHISRYRSRGFTKRLLQILKEEVYDLVLLEGLYLTPYIKYIRQCSKAPILYRAHNIEHYIWKRMASGKGYKWWKPYLKLQAVRLMKYETGIIHQLDGLIAISPHDLAFFRGAGYSGPAVLIPVGAEIPREADQAVSPEPGSVFHLGSMDWRPNLEGLHWFLKKTWPKVHSANPALRFYLAGRNIPPSLLSYDGKKQVHVMGEVENAQDFIRSKQLMAVPLLSGGGMRVKIVEGMALGKTIVTTPVGAEGIPCTHGKNIYLAKSAEQMAYWILHCFSHPAEALEVGRAARRFALAHFDKGRLSAELSLFLKSFAVRVKDN